MFDYKLDDSKSLYIAQLSFLAKITDYEDTKKKASSFKEKGDIEIIIPYFKEFTIQNVVSDDFFTAIINIKEFTTMYFYEEFNVFLYYDVFNTLFLLAFPAPGEERDFLQYISLNILVNLVDFPILQYATKIIEMDVIKLISKILNSPFDEVVNYAIQLLVSIAPIDISYSQDILSFINVDFLIHINQKFQNNSLIKRNINLLVYLLSRCDVKKETNQFIEFFRIRINEIHHQISSQPNNEEFDSIIGNIITLFQISHNLIKDDQIAICFKQFPEFIQLLNYSLSFNSENESKYFKIWEPAIKTIDFLHYLDDELIKGLNYQKLIPFLISNDEIISELITETFINILRSQKSVVLFVEKYNIINQLIITRSLELNYPTNKNAISAISNAILHSPKYLLPTFVETGCLVQLLDSLYIDDNSILCQIINCINILLSTHVLDEQKNDIAETEFIKYFDFSCINDILSNEEDAVRFSFENLIKNHPKFFSSEN